MLFQLHHTLYPGFMGQIISIGFGFHGCIGICITLVY